MQEHELITKNPAEFLRYFKTKFRLIHQSNVFFRDLHYGVLSYLEMKGKKLPYSDGEQVAREVASHFEKEKIFKRIDHQTYMLNYPEFALPRIEKKAS